MFINAASHSHHWKTVVELALRQSLSPIHDLLLLGDHGHCLKYSILEVVLPHAMRSGKKVKVCGFLVDTRL